MKGVGRVGKQFLQRLQKDSSATDAKHLASACAGVRHYSAVPQPIEGEIDSVCDSQSRSNLVSCHLRCVMPYAIWGCWALLCRTIALRRWTRLSLQTVNCMGIYHFLVRFSNQLLVVFEYSIVLRVRRILCGHLHAVVYCQGNKHLECLTDLAIL